MRSAGCSAPSIGAPGGSVKRAASSPSARVRTELALAEQIRGITQRLHVFLGLELPALLQPEHRGHLRARGTSS